MPTTSVGMAPSLPIAAIILAALCGSAAGGVFTAAQYGAEPSPQPVQPVRRSEAFRPAMTWQYYRPTQPAPLDIESFELRQLQNLRSSPSELPARRESTLFGHPARTDPLYDEVRPDWNQQHYERPNFARPAYEVPVYEKPLMGLDPIRAPTLDKPLYVLPNDNKPNNNLRFYAAPGYDRPTTPSPVPRGPNYVIESEFAPGYDHPAYNHPYYDRPEYQGPTYDPPQYAPPQNRPPDYVAPPQ